jgi:hypothetical protein
MFGAVSAEVSQYQGDFPGQQTHLMPDGVNISRVECQVKANIDDSLASNAVTSVE